MKSPYVSEYSFDDMKGFIGVVGNLSFQYPRHISSADVWHFLEVYEAISYREVVGGEYPHWIYGYGIDVTIVNRSMLNGERAWYFYYRVKSVPTGYENTGSASDVSVSPSSKIDIYPYILDSTATYSLPLANFSAYSGGELTLEWRWSESLPWNIVAVTKGY